MQKRNLSVKTLMSIGGSHLWKLNTTAQTRIGALAIDEDALGSGSMMYAKIRNFIGERSAMEFFDTTTVSAYSYARLDWVGYDNEQSVGTKSMHLPIALKQKKWLDYHLQNLPNVQPKAVRIILFPNNVVLEKFHSDMISTNTGPNVCVEDESTVECTEGISCSTRWRH
eukprot:Gb_10730 [translate_table: standard]